ncbi:hypothetical protein NUW58_g8452 [Xylaria curta]|uniref:Uncharacterized protein n=1 Tax=Xylaria curta TaxID=42375 RepID=A0ACC1N9I0_9PEZI|nr:hypothetical protein NUW58_g8452 [Xylaria curta]
MDSKSSRYQSRILREMRNHAEHPFSPPSSTGSHGTVTLTSQLSHVPDGESTREPMLPIINTSVLGRTFPEWKDHGKENRRPVSPGANNDSRSPDLVQNGLGRPLRFLTTRRVRPHGLRPVSPALTAKRVRSHDARSVLPVSPSLLPPFSPLSFDSPFPDTESIFGSDSPRLRAHQQAPVIEDTMELNPPLNPARGNLTTLLDTLKTARCETKQADQESAKRSSSQISPKSQLGAGISANAARRLNRQSQLNAHSIASPSVVNQTTHSFFVPNLNHLNDFVSGTLRWSSLKHGTPIFVKHGKVHDREMKRSQDHHADFEVVGIPREEEEIFVSLDKIRDEVQTLQEHDEFVSRQAGQLREEVCELQSHIAELKSRKDSAVGSEYDSSRIVQLTTQNTELEEQVTTLKSRLDQANRKISLNEIHNQSFVAERDEALQRASDHVTTIKRLQTRNDAITEQKLELQQAQKEAEKELDSLRGALDGLHQKYERVSKEKNLLQDNNLSLERNNEDLFNNNKLLQQKNSLLERENSLLHDQAVQLQDKVEELNKKLSQRTETPRYLQEPKGAMPSLGRSKLTKMTQNWESGDRFTVVSDTSAKAMSSRAHLAREDDDTRESDFTRDSRRRYSQESKGSVPVTGKLKLTKMAQISEPGDRHTVVSEMSAKSMTSHTDLQMQDDYTQQIDLTREPQLDSDQENMTSALFIDDITLDSHKKFTQKQKAKSTPSVRVLSPVLSITEPSTQTEQATMGGQSKANPPPRTHAIR